MEKGAAQAALDLSPGGLVVLYLGRLVPFKRVDLLLEAWSRLTADGAKRLVVVGVGPEAEALRSMATRLRVNARFDGPTDRSWDYLRAADIFVLPSGDHRLQEYEGLSVALLEAMAAGLTVVVTEGPGNDMVVEEGVTGLKFPIGSVDGLVTQLDRALASPDLRRELSSNASAHVRGRYAADVVARQVLDFYAAASQHR